MGKPLERLSAGVEMAKRRLQKADWRPERRPLKRSLAGALAWGLKSEVRGGGDAGLIGIRSEIESRSRTRRGGAREAGQRQ